MSGEPARVHRLALLMPRFLFATCQHGLLENRGKYRYQSIAEKALDEAMLLAGGLAGDEITRAEASDPQCQMEIAFQFSCATAIKSNKGVTLHALLKNCQNTNYLTANP